jgi:uncharacterized membrane protein YphA (DoxX/SURF4 family)
MQIVGQLYRTPKIRRLRIVVANVNETCKLFESRVSAFMAENGILVTRLALGVIFLWFGILKFAPGLSEAEDLAKRTLVKVTLGHVPAQVCVYILAVWECAIGVGFLSGRFLRSTLILLFLQLPGTFLPLLFFPSETWKRIPYAPTLEGQYILKNLVLISAGIIIGSTMRGGRIVSEPRAAQIADGLQHFYIRFRQRFQRDPHPSEALRVAQHAAEREDSASNSDRR